MVNSRKTVFIHFLQLARLLTAQKYINLSFIDYRSVIEQFHIEANLQVPTSPHHK